MGPKKATGSQNDSPSGVAPQAGLEPATLRLTAGCSTIELLWNRSQLLGFGRCRFKERTGSHGKSRTNIGKFANIVNLRFLD